MAGTALTTRFMKTGATLMLGPMSSLYDLQPSTNSLGLVKNVSTMADPTFLDLTQGSMNSLVWSSLTSNPVKMTAEIFEYTVQNLGYALGLDGSTLVTQTHAPYLITSPTGGAETTLTFTGVGGLIVGDTLMFVDKTTDDRMMIRKITVIAGNDVTLDRAVTGVWPTTTDILEVNVVPIGSTVNPPFLSCKIAGQLADGTPAVLLFGKVRLGKGFTMAWNTDQYGNMPFEFEALEMVPTDTFYADFPNRRGSLSIQ